MCYIFFFEIVIVLYYIYEPESFWVGIESSCLAASYDSLVAFQFFWLHHINCNLKENKCNFLFYFEWWRFHFIVIFSTALYNHFSVNIFLPSLNVISSKTCQTSNLNRSSTHDSNFFFLKCYDNPTPSIVTFTRDCLFDDFKIYSSISFPKNLNPKNIIFMKFGKFLIMLGKWVGKIYSRE